MSILKNSKELLDHLQSPNSNLITSIKSFDLSTLYTTTLTRNLKQTSKYYKELLPLQKLKLEIQIFGLGREGPYFVREHSDSKSKYTREDIIKMLEYLVDNISWSSRERVSNR